MEGMTVQVATAVIEAGMSNGMFPQGQVPELDAAKIEEASKLVQLSQHAKIVADQIGRENMPNWGAAAAVLTAAGVPVDAPVANGATAAAPIPPPPPVEAPPVPPTLAPVPPALVAAAAPTPDELARNEALRQAAELAAASPPPPVAPPVQATDYAPRLDERWLDGEGNEWHIIEYAGGPHLQARFVPTGEVTVLPVSFLIQRAAQPAPTIAPMLPMSQAAPPAPAPQVQAPAPVQQPAAPPPPPAPTGMDVFVAPVPGQRRIAPGDGNAYVLSRQEGEVVYVTDIFGGHEGSLSATDWSTWVLAEGSGLEPEPDQRQERAEAQQIVVPMDDDEGDDDYAALLGKVRSTYNPTGMPAPMDLERPPTGIPEDLTMVDDIEARRLHSQFNALASRARYLHGLEAAKGRACDRIYKHHLKGAMREARQTLGKDASVTEVQQLAEDNEIVANWLRRRDKHADDAEAYKTFLALYSEDVTVLSRDWSMRATEEKGA